MERAESRSPYAVALGASFETLHPRLRTYFSSIPAGHLGSGSGTWDSIGTPRTPVRLLLRLVAREGIAFPCWEHDVPFLVRNRPAQAAGRPAVDAEREFALSAGARTMVDRITVDRSGNLVDLLGRTRRLRATFRATVVDGVLTLRSTRLDVRLGRRYVPVPQPLAPRVDLTERFDDEADRQHVEVVVSAPLLGRLYEYSGRFDYRIVPQEAPHG